MKGEMLTHILFTDLHEEEEEEDNNRKREIRM
jgi:hypothetical protein